MCVLTWYPENGVMINISFGSFKVAGAGYGAMNSRESTSSTVGAKWVFVYARIYDHIVISEKCSACVYVPAQSC